MEEAQVLSYPLAEWRRLNTPLIRANTINGNTSSCNARIKSSPGYPAECPHRHLWVAAMRRKLANILPSLVVLLGRTLRDANLKWITLRAATHLLVQRPIVVDANGTKRDHTQARILLPRASTISASSSETCCSGTAPIMTSSDHLAAHALGVGYHFSSHCGQRETKRKQKHTSPPGQELHSQKNRCSRTRGEVSYTCLEQIVAGFHFGHCNMNHGDE